ncbi:MAG: M20/M25/M40 family metallo-hydrolase, partial [bacterium]
MRTKKSIRYIMLVAFIAFFVFPLFAQKTSIRIDGQDIKDRITLMSVDKQMGRMTLTAEFHQLHEWAANQFKSWGLEPAGDNGTYFGAVPITGNRGTFAFTYGTPKLTIDNREFFIKFGDFSIDHRSTTAKALKGNVVFIGYGISAPAKGLDEYDGVDVSGKFVFAFKGDPKDAKAARGFFGSGGDEQEEKSQDDWTVESKDSTKVMTAYEKGAAGIILYNTERDSDQMFRFRREPVYASPFTRDFMVVSDVSERVFQWMFWKDPQESDRAFSRRMSDMRLEIKKKKAQSFKTGVNVVVKGFDKTDLYGEPFGKNMCRNVLAKITGSDPVLKDEYIVLGGHFDHLGVRNGQVLNGADDDASGSAVVMEVARLMGTHKIKPKRTVIFALWTGEEMGLIGSRYWVNHPTAGVTMDKTVLNFNLDMVGLGESVGAPGALNFPSIWEILKKDQDKDIIDAVNPSEGGPGGSDHSGFIELGIESLALMTRGGGGHPDYHD